MIRFLTTILLFGLTASFVQAQSVRPIRLDDENGYFVTRPFLEYALLQMEMAPRHLDRLSALQAELAAADIQITARDTLIARLEASEHLATAIAGRERRKADQLSTAVKAAEKKWKRMKWWRPLALGATAAAVVLALK